MLKMIQLQAHTQGEIGAGGGGRVQIISKSCSFSPEAEFTPLTLASKSEFSFKIHTPLCKIRTPFFKSLHTGLNWFPFNE